MSDLVPDRGSTYAGPYGRFPVYERKRSAPPEPDATAQLIARLREEVRVVRAVNEDLRIERVEVEQALGHSVHAGQLAQAVKMAIYREAGR